MGERQAEREGAAEGRGELEGKGSRRGDEMLNFPSLLSLMQILK